MDRPKRIYHVVITEHGDSRTASRHSSRAGAAKEARRVRAALSSYEAWVAAGSPSFGA